MGQKQQSYFSPWFCVLWLSSALFFSGCLHFSGSDDPIAIFRGQSIDQLYTTAKTEFEQNNYEKAVKVYEALEILYPFNDYSEKAFVHLIESYYHKRDMPAVISAAQRFLHIYPKSTQIETIYYLKGLAHLHQDRGFFLPFIKIDLSYRYPAEMWLAYQTFAGLVRLYPDSVYVPDAKQAMIEMRELFAKYELHIAQFYLDKQIYVAALNRATSLIETYPESSILDQAKQIQATAKQRLALDDQDKQSFLSE